MNIVVITRPDSFHGEFDVIHRMFEMGLPLLHVRKPDFSYEELSDFIQHVNPKFYNRLVLHDHHSLAVKYGLYGIHLNSRNPSPLDGWTGSISRSCHSLSELQDDSFIFNYQFLSPIYNSISKKGYNSAFSFSQLKLASLQGVINSNVYALGGVSISNLSQIKDLGFGGAVLLGEPWIMSQSPNNAFNSYFISLLKYID